MHTQALFLHFPVDVNSLQARLPAGLEVHTHQGKGWVGVVALTELGISPALPFVPRGLQRLLRLGHHAVNVRTCKHPCARALFLAACCFVYRYLLSLDTHLSIARVLPCTHTHINMFMCRHIFTICLCMNVLIHHTHALCHCLSLASPLSHTHIHNHIHAHIHSLPPSLTHTYETTYMHTYTHACTQKCTHEHKHTGTHTQIHMHKHTQVYAYRTHIHT